MLLKYGIKLSRFHTLDKNIPVDWMPYRHQNAGRNPKLLISILLCVCMRLVAPSYEATKKRLTGTTRYFCTVVLSTFLFTTLTTKYKHQVITQTLEELESWLNYRLHFCSTTHFGLRNFTFAAREIMPGHRQYPTHQKNRCPFVLNRYLQSQTLL